jgi:phosphocarrier protein HPr
MKEVMSATELAPDTVMNIFEVTNKLGIHARPAAMIVRITNKYSDTDIWVEKDDERVNGKSIMGLMMLAAGYRTQLKFIVKGKYAQKLIAEMKDLFDRKFEEN